MKKLVILIIIFFMFISGCSTVKVVPEQVPAGVINPKDNSQEIVRDDLSVTVAPADISFVNYNVESMIAAFNVDIMNYGKSEVTFDSQSFVLIDADKRQYYQVTPEKIRQMMARDTFYLLPYPYIGFYYLEDYELSSFKDSTNSNLPYYYEYRPQELFSRALPTDPVIPKARIKGLVYFNTDVYALTSFTINVFKKNSDKSAGPDFSFPFKVIK